MSEAEDNPNNKRLVFANMDVERKTLMPNQYSLKYQYNPMDTIRTLEDGIYWIDVISGGRYASSDPERYCINKDTTPANIKTEYSLGYSGWLKGSAPFKINVSDNYSGVYSADVICDGEVLSGSVVQDYEGAPLKGSYTVKNEGINSVDIQVYDRANNYKDRKLVLKVDASKPEYSLSEEFMGTDVVKDKWINASELRGQVYINDNLSGFYYNDKYCFKLYRCINSSTSEVARNDYEMLTPDNYNMQITLTPAHCSAIKSGRYIYMYEAYDVVGNKRRVNLYLNIDKEAPCVDTDIEKSWSISKKKGNLHIYDEMSGIDSVLLMVDDKIIDSIYGVGKNEYTMYCDLSETDTNRKYSHLYVTDVAGNSYDYPIQTSHSDKPLFVTAQINNVYDNDETDFKVGDHALLTASVWAYPEKIEFVFPKGLEQYNATLFPEDEYACNHSIEFIIPDNYDGEYYVQVTGYREESSVTKKVRFNVVREDMGIRTRIRKR